MGVNIYNKFIFFFIFKLNFLLKNSQLNLSWENLYLNLKKKNKNLLKENKNPLKENKNKNNKIMKIKWKKKNPPNDKI